MGERPRIHPSIHVLLFCASSDVGHKREVPIDRNLKGVGTKIERDDLFLESL